MLVTFQKYINAQFPFLKGKKLLIALSGGIDSVVLTHLLLKSKFDLQLAHCNFRLRGKESDKDAQFVHELAKKLGLEIHAKGFDTERYAQKKKLSIQMAARELRYDWFDELLKVNKLDYIITAHHLNDSLETFLINFTRGTGLEGLTGIPEMNNTIIRPLLAFSRTQIEAFANENNIIWREDISNSETKYIRNKIRHEVIPLLEEINPQLLQSFRNTTTYLQQSQEIIDDKIIEVVKDVIIEKNNKLKKLNITKIKELSHPQAYLYELLKKYNFTEWNDVYSLLDAQSGKQVLSATHRLIKDRNFLLLQVLSKENKASTFTINERDNELKTNEFSMLLCEVKHAELVDNDQCRVYVDADKLCFPLRLRKWQEGDYFYPLGMKGKKKLSKYFKDEKLSLLDKERVWLLCTQNKIIWAVGKRLDDRFKVTKETKKIVQIEYKEA